MSEIHDLYLDAVKIAELLAHKGELRGIIHDDPNSYLVTISVTVPKEGMWMKMSDLKREVL